MRVASERARPVVEAGHIVTVVVEHAGCSCQTVEEGCVAGVFLVHVTARHPHGKGGKKADAIQDVRRWIRVIALRTRLASTYISFSDQAKSDLIGSDLTAKLSIKTRLLQSHREVSGLGIAITVSSEYYQRQ